MNGVRERGPRRPAGAPPGIHRLAGIREHRRFRFGRGAALALAILVSGNGNAQPSGPDAVIHTVGPHRLMQRHVTAYIRIELEGEDPALLHDSETVEELTRELLEDFEEDPQEVLADLEAYIGGNAGHGEGSGSRSSPESAAAGKATPQVDAVDTGPWTQLLTGSVLYYTSTESQGGLFVQSTQFLHLCPDGLAHFYQSSAGGGDVGGVGISDPGGLGYTGSARWSVASQGGAVYFQAALPGTGPGLFPMRRVNDGVLIQGLGNFSVRPGAAVCRSSQR